MRDYRQDLADRLGLEVERLHFEVKKGQPPQFEILVDGQDLTQEQEHIAVSFIQANPGAAAVSKARPVEPAPCLPCHSCDAHAIGGVRIPNTLRTYLFCEEHQDGLLAEADRVHRIINKPCSGCGAPAPYFHHTTDCPRLNRK
jgi:hypothetical protein